MTSTRSVVPEGVPMGSPLLKFWLASMQARNSRWARGHAVFHSNATWQPKSPAPSRFLAQSPVSWYWHDGKRPYPGLLGSTVLDMQSRIPNDREPPIDFPRVGDDFIRNYLRWQECVSAGEHVANMCFDAKFESGLSGNNDELLARSVYLVCGKNFTDEESCWIVRHSAAQLGW